MTDWDEVVGQHGKKVWRTAYRLLGNDADACDCFQRVFMDAIQIAQREPVRDWSGLLGRLATTRAIDLLRDRYRHRKRGEPLADPEVLLSRNPGPRQEAEAADLADRLRLSLADLPQRQAEAFCLRWLDELSYEEIAQRFDIDTNAVAALLHRARTRLRQLLVEFDCKRDLEREVSP